MAQLVFDSPFCRGTLEVDVDALLSVDLEQMGAGGEGEWRRSIGQVMEAVVGRRYVEEVTQLGPCLENRAFVALTAVFVLAANSVTPQLEDVKPSDYPEEESYDVAMAAALAYLMGVRFASG